MKKLISVDELFELLNSEKKYVILDCRFDLMNKTYGIDSYKKSHIKGAFLVDIENDLAEKPSIHGGRHPFTKVERFVEIIKSFGIDNDTTVITYDDGDLQGAGRLVYQLNSIGFDNARALDGGITAYIHNGGEIESKENIPTKSKQDLDLNLKNDMIVNMNYVKSKLYDENTILIDSRSNPRYLGLEEPVDKVAGHIPSAKNFFFMDILNIDDMRNSSFKSDEFLKEHFSSLFNDKEKIVYCGSGISLMVNALALDKLGIDYKIYPGSFSDWISYDENEVMTGEE